MGRPAAAFYRGTADNHVWCHAVLDGSCVNERLVVRARLPQPLGRIVEFVCMEIVTADHADDLAAVRIDRDYRCLDLGHLRELDIKGLVFLVDAFDQEFGKKAWFELVFWPLAASSHIAGPNDSLVPAKPDANL